MITHILRASRGLSATYPFSLTSLASAEVSLSLSDATFIRVSRQLIRIVISTPINCSISFTYIASYKSTNIILKIKAKIHSIYPHDIFLVFRMTKWRHPNGFWFCDFCCSPATIFLQKSFYCIKEDCILIRLNSRENLLSSQLKLMR